MSKHPVSALQEKMAKINKPLPTYTIQSSNYATGNKFICTVQVAGITAEGSGSTKQNAKLEAAKNALAKLENPDGVFVKETTPEPVMNPLGITDGNYVGKLNELTSQHRVTTPTYSEFGVDEKNNFIIGCVVLNKCTKGFAPTKKQAKQSAAREMLAILNATSINSLKQTIPDLVDFSDRAQQEDALPKDEDIMETFKMLSVANSRPKKQDNAIDLLTGCSSLLTSPSSSPSKVTVVKSSTDELWKELEQVAPITNLQILQTRPKTVLALNIGDTEEITVMEMGENYDEALCNLLTKAIILAKSL